MMDKPFLDMTSVLGGLLLALVFLGSVDAQGSASTCVPVVRVRRNTVKVFRKNPLRISCPVKYCEEIPTVRWFRVDETGRLIPVNPTDEITFTEEVSTAVREIISYLNFRNISIQDDGIYKCQVSALNYTSESHSVNVSVSDTILETSNQTNSNTSDIPPFLGSIKPYIIICSGILTLVTVVMVVSFLSLRGCKGSRKANNQRTHVPPSPNIGGHLRGQEKSRKKGLDMSKETPEPDMPALHSAMNQRNTKDDQGPQQIVYATLEHLTPRDTTLISIPSREQLSEYAAIRIY